MTKLRVGLIAVVLLAMAVPAKAQTADPLGLIASGAVIPYVLSPGLNIVGATGGFTGQFLGTGSISILEVASPVGSNAPPEESAFGAKSLHMFFFDQSCARVGPSVGFPLTTNGSGLLNLSNINGLPNAGLLAAAGVDNKGGVDGFLQPLSNPIHARVYWINAVDGVLSRILEPVQISNAEALSINKTWNPLRTAATFTSPLVGSGVSTTLYLVCPTQLIIPGPFPEESAGATVQTALTAATVATDHTIALGSVSGLAAGDEIGLGGPPGIAPTFTIAAGGVNTTAKTVTLTAAVGAAYPSGTVVIGPTVGAGVCPEGAGNCFPPLRPLPVAGTGTTPLFLRVFDNDENFRRNIHVGCRCWGAHPVTEWDDIYANADPFAGAPLGTYTEVEGDQPGAEAVAATCDNNTAPCSFTGYRSIQWGSGTVGNNLFGRLSNGSIPFIDGLPPINIDFPTIPPIGNALR